MKNIERRSRIFLGGDFFKKLTALLLVLVILSFVAFSSFLKGEHECCGAHCTICILSENIALACTVIISMCVSAVMVVAIFTKKLNTHTRPTLITLKKKLTD